MLKNKNITQIVAVLVVPSNVAHKVFYVVNLTSSAFSTWKVIEKQLSRAQQCTTVAIKKGRSGEIFGKGVL